MSALARGTVGVLLLAVLALGGIALLHSGIYGWTIFIVAPVMLGGVVAWVVRPATGLGAVAAGSLATALALCSVLILGLDGLYCVLMALPLAAPLGALGSWLVYRAERSGTAARGGIALLLLLPPAAEVRQASERAAGPARLEQPTQQRTPELRKKDLDLAAARQPDLPRGLAAHHPIPK